MGGDIRSMRGDPGKNVNTKIKIAAREEGMREI